jgi:hypothetical protein
MSVSSLRTSGRSKSTLLKPTLALFLLLCSSQIGCIQSFATERIVTLRSLRSLSTTKPSVATRSPGRPVFSYNANSGIQTKSRISWRNSSRFSASVSVEALEGTDGQARWKFWKPLVRFSKIYPASRGWSIGKIWRNVRRRRVLHFGGMLVTFLLVQPLMAVASGGSMGIKKGPVIPLERYVPNEYTQHWFCYYTLRNYFHAHVSLYLALVAKN